jgi:hypothetical protein
VESGRAEGSAFQIERVLSANSVTLFELAAFP